MFVFRIDTRRLCPLFLSLSCWMCRVICRSYPAFPSISIYSCDLDTYSCRNYLYVSSFATGLLYPSLLSDPTDTSHSVLLAIDSRSVFYIVFVLLCYILYL